MTTRPLVEPGSGHGLLYRTLDDRLVDVMTSLLSAVMVPPSASLWEDPLPLPVPSRAWVLPFQRVGHEHPAVTFINIALMRFSDPNQMLPQRNYNSGG